MEKTDLTVFDRKPEGMVNYLRYNGPHFNKKLYEFAVSKMKRKQPGSNSLVRITPWTREEVDNMLESAGVRLDRNEDYDYMYVAAMIKADFYESSIEDKVHAARYIKDVIDDEDAYDGIVFNRWFADTRRKGLQIPWEELV